jgi:hypothetical protein
VLSGDHVSDDSSNGVDAPACRPAPPRPESDTTAMA